MATATTMSFLLLWVALMALSIHALESTRMVDVLNDKKKHKRVAKKKRYGDVQELFLEQPLNHFRSSPSTFSQRYFVSHRFASNNDTAFLCVGGEGPALDASVLVDSVHCSDMLEMARQVGATVYALEHRYYGESYPELELTNENLVYLSSRQALEDLARFVQSHPQHTTWITWGGSYPGMLAAWARLKHPDLIHAAVSASAPLQAVVQFPGYQRHVGQVLPCRLLVQAGHQALLAEVEDPARQGELAVELSLCNASALVDPMNRQLLLGDGLFYWGVQENDPSCLGDYCNIDKKCAALEAFDGSPRDAIVWMYHELQGDEYLEVDWQGTMDYIRNPAHRGVRSWLWQTCNEFGFYQTCGDGCLFGTHTIDQDLQLCEYAFGVEAAFVFRNVDATLAHYGGLDLESSRILSITGTIDPWSEQALLPPTRDPSLPLYSVPGASHHFWTHAPKDTDDEAIVQARGIIYETVRGWLAEHRQEIAQLH